MTGRSNSYMMTLYIFVLSIKHNCYIIEKRFDFNYNYFQNKKMIDHIVFSVRFSTLYKN